MNEDILGLLGVDVKGAKEKAFARGLLSTVLNAAQLSGPQARPMSNTQALGQLGLGAMQAYDTSFDQTLKEALTGMQLKDTFAKREREANLQKALQGAYTERVSPTLGLGEQQVSSPITQAEIEAFGPSAYMEAAKTAAPTERVFDRQKALSALAQYGGPEGLATYLSATKPADLPGVVGEFDAAKRAGLIPADSTLEQYVAMKRPPGTTVNVGDKEDSFQKKAREAQATMFSDIQKSGTQASRSLKDVNRLGTILERVNTGAGAAFKQIAGNFGIDTKGLDELQAAQAIINRLVPQQRPPGSGTMSDADLDLYKQSLPRLINQPGANKEIVRSMKEINEYMVKEGEIASAVLDGEITPAEGRRRLRELGNPVQDFFDRNPTASPGSPVAPISKDDLSLINRYRNK